MASPSTSSTAADNNNTADDWTLEFLIDELKQHLAKVIDPVANSVNQQQFDIRKYYHRAHHYLKASAFQPIPPFVIDLEDLSPRIIRELYQVDRDDCVYILRQAVGRIIEDVNSKIYHNCISKILTVKIQVS